MTSSHNPWITFWIASAAVFIVTLDGTAVVAAYSALRADFVDATPAGLSWTLNAYTIVYAALLVPCGRLADLHGRRRMYLIGVTLFSLASLVCALADSLPFLVAARIAQSSGAALLTPATLALLLAAFPSEKRAAVVGLFTAIGALAAAIGPALGSFIIEHASWRWIFLINLPLGLLGWWFGRRHLRESTSPETGARLDIVGVALLIIGSALIALGVVKTREWGWSGSFTWATIFSGLGVLGGFFFWARGRADAALDIRLFDEPSYRYVNLATLVFSIGFSMMFLSAFLVLIDLWRFSHSLAGIAITPGPLIALPVAIVMSRVAGRIGHRPMLVSGGILFSAAQLWLFLQLTPQPNFFGVWFPSQVIGGIGVGLVLPALSGAAVAKLQAARYAVGGSVNNAMRQLGSAIGAALAIALVGGIGTTLEEFRQLYLVLAAIGLLTAVICIPVQTRPSSV